MVIYHTTLVSQLNTLGYPVYFEKFDIEKQTPCITYMEISNTDYANGDTLSYSELAFQIKVWGSTMAEIVTITASIDTLLKTLGFTRTLAFDTTDANFFVKVMRYNGMGYER